MRHELDDAEALDRLVEKWGAQIGRSANTTVEAILIQAESVGAALRALRPYGPRACRLLQARTRLSEPMMSKLAVIGRQARLMRPKAERPPPSLSSLYLLSHRLLKAMEIDLRWMSRTDILQFLAGDHPRSAMCHLMTVKVPLDTGT